MFYVGKGAACKEGVLPTVFDKDVSTKTEKPRVWELPAIPI